MTTHKYIDSTRIFIEIIRTDADWGWNKDLYLNIIVNETSELYYVGKSLTSTKQIVIETNQTIKLLPTDYNQKIPKKIFQTWKTNYMDTEMLNTIKIIKNLNPEYEYKLFTDNDCIEYLKNNFDNTVVSTFNNLVPGAFKADLFRYCVLYKEGGIYIDCKMIPLKPFRQIIKPEDTCVLVFNTFEKNSTSIYNAFMCSEPNNKLFLECVKQIVDNCTNLYYPLDPFAITGPTLLYKIYKKMNCKYRLLSHPNIGLPHTDHNNGIFNELNQVVVYKTYKNYYKNANGGDYIKKYQLGNCYANILDLLTVYSPSELKKIKNNDFVIAKTKPFDNFLFINQSNEFTIDTTNIKGTDGLLLITCDNIWLKLAEIDLTKFSQIYIKAKTFFNEPHVCIQNKIDMFKKLNETHKLIHADGDNNYETIDINNFKLPILLSLTYVRSDLDNFKINNQQIPSDSTTCEFYQV
jgi:mannosyltransferase OCH1-like enzyme